MMNNKIYHAMIVFSKPSEKTPGKRQLDMATATFGTKEQAIEWIEYQSKNVYITEDKKGKLYRIDEIEEVCE